MADGYARASNRPGIILAGQNGPGATNLTTGLAQAFAAYSPVISIAGSLSTEHIYKDAFQEVDVTGITLPITKHNYLVTDINELSKTIFDAFEIARTGRPGPVVIDITKDVQNAKTIYNYPKAASRTVSLNVPNYETIDGELSKAITLIKQDLKKQIKIFDLEKKFLEKQRIEERTTFDLEMMETTGSCSGIENYSRYLSGRKPGEPPPTLYEYIPEDSLLFIDESHITCSQISGMYKGDRSRKSTLATYGFRLPSCLDNRPLKREEWDSMRPQTIFVSATPADFELNKTCLLYTSDAADE